MRRMRSRLPERNRFAWLRCELVCGFLVALFGRVGRLAHVIPHDANRGRVPQWAAVANSTKMMISITTSTVMVTA